MYDKPMQIAYCGNQRVFPLILLSLLSVGMRTEEPVRVYILTMDLSDLDPRYLPMTERERAIFEEAVRRGNPSSSVTLLDGRDAYMRLLHGGKNEKNHYTPYAMGRLLLPELGLGGKILYFDSDVMCCSSLAAFDEIELGTCEFAAALDEMGKFWIRRDYCNSGVMLIDLDRVRQTGLFARACERVRGRRMAFPDQSALNRLVKEKKILPRRFNEQRGVREDTVVKHFCRGIRWLPFFKVYNYKQTEVANVREKLGIRCFDDVYAEYGVLAAKFSLPPLEQ